MHTGGIDRSRKACRRAPYWLAGCKHRKRCRSCRPSSGHSAVSCGTWGNEANAATVERIRGAARSQAVVRSPSHAATRRTTAAGIVAASAFDIGAVAQRQRMQRPITGLALASNTAVAAGRTLGQPWQLVGLAGLAYFALSSSTASACSTFPSVFAFP